jgi:hypothetical protein
MNGRYSIDPKKVQEAVDKANSPLEVTTTLLTWCAVHGALQMALRHPEFPPTTRAILEPLIEQLGQALVDADFFTGDTLQESIDREKRFHAKKITKS